MRVMLLLMSFLIDLGRKPIETKDISGFVSNSVLMVYARDGAAPARSGCDDRDC